ncbi:MAG: hypothetical protein KA436_06500 [Oligoflexales bacterium]|nr:hypothetical protein [Oligoflexales bacterium]
MFFCQKNSLPVYSLGLLMTFLSCGPNSPSVQEQTSFQMKTDESSHQGRERFFGLVKEGGSKVQEFEGSLILWNPEAEHAAMSEVLTLSAQSKHADAEYKQSALLDEQLKQARAKVDAIRETIRQDGEDKVSTFYKGQSAGLLVNSQDWVKRSFTDPVGPLGDKKSDFEEFCGLNLLRMASSLFLKSYEFSSRPSPLGLCEPYYETQKIFLSDACQNPPSGKGNYFRCFWEAVFDSAVIPNYKSLRLRALNNRKELESLKQKIDDLFVLPDLERVLNKGMVFGNSWVYYLEGAKKLVFPRDRFKKQVDAFSSSVNIGLDLLTTEDTYDDGVRLSWNDRLFNLQHVKDGRELATKAPSKDLKDKVETAQADADFSLILGHVLPVFSSMSAEEKVALQAEIDQWQARIDVLLVEKSHVKESTDQKLDALNLLRDAAARKIFVNKLGFSLWPSVNLKLNFQSDRLQVELRFAKHHSEASGCVFLNQSHADDCVGTNKNQEELSVSLDPETGRLTLEMFVKDPGSLGFETVSPGEPSRFQNLPESDFLKRRLVLTLDPLFYDQAWDMMVGSLFVKDPDHEETLFQGNLTLSKTVH